MNLILLIDIVIFNVKTFVIYGALLKLKLYENIISSIRGMYNSYRFKKKIDKKEKFQNVILLNKMSI